MGKLGVQLAGGPRGPAGQEQEQARAAEAQELVWSNIRHGTRRYLPLQENVALEQALGGAVAASTRMCGFNN